MLHVALFEPEIPPNTGNIIRLCANTGAQLHLIQPMGFTLVDAKLRRAGLDYHEFATVRQYQSFDDFLTQAKPNRLFSVSTKGKTFHHEVTYQADDMLLFGPESRGLPDEILQSIAAKRILKIPMRPNSRSLNLANAVAVMVYEAWRQLKFK